MNPEAFNALLEQVAAGAVSARTALRILVETYAWDQTEAEEAIFIALGGDDVVVTGVDGVDRYLASGRTVAEVAAAMER